MSKASKLVDKINEAEQVSLASDSQNIAASPTDNSAPLTRLKFRCTNPDCRYTKMATGGPKTTILCPLCSSALQVTAGTNQMLDPDNYTTSPNTEESLMEPKVFRLLNMIEAADGTDGIDSVLDDLTQDSDINVDPVVQALQTAFPNYEGEFRISTYGRDPDSGDIVLNFASDLPDGADSVIATAFDVDAERVDVEGNIVYVEDLVIDDSGDASESLVGDGPISLLTESSKLSLVKSYGPAVAKKIMQIKAKIKPGFKIKVENGQVKTIKMSAQELMHRKRAAAKVASKMRGKHRKASSLRAAAKTAALGARFKI